MFLHITRAHEQGQICTYGLKIKISLRKQFLRFYNPTLAAKKPKNNRFRVPGHFATNRCTFEKFPPPPPLLHPNRKKSAMKYLFQVLRIGMSVVQLFVSNNVRFESTGFHWSFQKRNLDRVTRRESCRAKDPKTGTKFHLTVDLSLKFKMAYSETKIRQDIIVFFRWKSPGYVFNVTFWHLLPTLLIDSMRQWKEFLWIFLCFSGFSSPRWDQKLILPPEQYACCSAAIKHGKFNEDLQKLLWSYPICGPANIGWDIHHSVRFHG